MMIRSNGTVELDGVAVGEFFGDGYMVNEKGVELGITTEMIRESAQNWIPANDGTETPVLTRTGQDFVLLATGYREASVSRYGNRPVLNR